MKIRYANAFTLALLWLGLSGACTYDSTPPGEDKINDGKPLVMIDATGLGANRRVEVRVTDALGTVTRATAAEKTDGTGRLLYPLYLARGTRNYDLQIIVDVNANSLFNDGGTDLRYSATAATIASDSEIKNLRLSATDFLAL
ncbi:hypothetical protein [Turneriella parva]|uniref:Lipoprotein n=1 Tax=Turneriella parva (strain ATCC BAA-1111 / DSM 21527 / NCTC 11395 / H) TaxID=869212 RepID=I4BAJ4_TURPD|nr:hypothetical protein [Turneriella parva]AFM14301.1 hypothetical protein Turpa_3667 [Turneriella parva DSM 21527]